MKTSKKGIDLIKSFEGLYLDAYICPAGVWSIGYGTTLYEGGRSVKAEDKITEERANELLLSDLAHFESCVNKLVWPPVNQNQFDALVSFAYNLGCGSLERSTLLKKVKANPSDPTIRNEFMRWNKANKKVLPGLTKRREAEANLYFEI